MTKNLSLQEELESSTKAHPITTVTFGELWSALRNRPRPTWLTWPTQPTWPPWAPWPPWPPWPTWPTWPTWPPDHHGQHDQYYLHEQHDLHDLHDHHDHILLVMWCEFTIVSSKLILVSTASTACGVPFSLDFGPLGQILANFSQIYALFGAPLQAYIIDKYQVYVSFYMQLNSLYIRILFVSVELRVPASRHWSGQDGCQLPIVSLPPHLPISRILFMFILWPGLPNNNWIWIC